MWLYGVVVCCVVWRCGMRCCAPGTVVYDVVQCGVVRRAIVWCCDTLWFCVMVYGLVWLCCVVLCCVVLCCVVLRYAVVWYGV